MSSHSQIPSDNEHLDPDAITIPVAPAILSVPAAALVVVSQDPMLLEAITTAATGMAAVTVWPSANRIMEQLSATRADLLMLDPAYAPAALTALLESLHHQFPVLPLLLVGPGTVQHQLQTLIANGTVFRFIHKPASAQRLRLFVDAALRESVKFRLDPSANASAVLGKAPTRPPRSRIWVIAALAAVVLATTGMLVWHSRRSNAPMAPVQAASKPMAPPVSITPVASQIPEPAPATLGSAAVATPAKELPAAQRQSPKLAGAEQAQHPLTDARSRRIDELVQLAQSRIESGALIEPNNDSARAYVNSATNLAPEDQRVRAMSLALGEAMVAEFHKGMAAGDLSAAAQWLQASKVYPIARMTLNRMSAQLDAARAAPKPHEVASSAVPAIAAGQNGSTPAAQVAAPATSNEGSAAAIGSSDQIIPEGRLKRLKLSTPEYPQEALQRGQTGIVEMDFTLTPNGTVTDIKVTQSTPVGVFDYAAMTALSRNRYEPIKRNGTPVSQRVHVRMRFAL